MQGCGPGGRGAFAAGLVLLLCSAVACGLEGNAVKRGPPEPIEEDAEIVLLEEGSFSPAPSPEAPLSPRFAAKTHFNIATLSAVKWELPADRVKILEGAADDPDHDEAGLENGYNQQWSHAYLYDPLGTWVWGDANENFDDCITGRFAEQIEGPECKDGQSARQWYMAGDQAMGDYFLGYAAHYIQDVSFVLHASLPSVDMLTAHTAYEKWIRANWSAGHRLASAVEADNYYYPISDLQRSVRNAAWAASYWNPNSAGQKAWDAYCASDYPTGAGTGNTELVLNTKIMLIRASRYTLGTIKYSLDTYDQWTSFY